MFSVAKDAVSGWTLVRLAVSINQIDIPTMELRDIRSRLGMFSKEALWPAKRQIQNSATKRNIFT
jgi:hypothetical protein